MNREEAKAFVVKLEETLEVAKHFADGGEIELDTSVNYGNWVKAHNFDVRLFGLEYRKKSEYTPEQQAILDAWEKDHDCIEYRGSRSEGWVDRLGPEKPLLPFVLCCDGYRIKQEKKAIRRYVGIQGNIKSAFAGSSMDENLAAAMDYKFLDEQEVTQ